MNLLRTGVVFAALLAASSAFAQPTAAIDCLDEQAIIDAATAEELILQPSVFRSRITGVPLLAYSYNGAVYLPVAATLAFVEEPFPNSSELQSLGCYDGVDSSFLRIDRMESLLSGSAVLDLSRLTLTLQSAQAFAVQQRLKQEQRLEHSKIKARRRRVNYDAPLLMSDYRWAEWPTLNVSLFAGKLDSDDNLDSRYTLRATGDLLKSSADFLLFGNDEKVLDTFTGSLSRYDQNAGLLGPLGVRQIEVGEVRGLSDGLLSLGRSGRGVRLSTLPLQRTGSFDTTTLSGPLAPGWSVELLRNGELLSNFEDDGSGRYEFTDVVLEFGGNSFVLNFYGPAGERRSEVVQQSITSSSLRAGERNFEFVANQTDKGLDGRQRDDTDGLRLLGDWLQFRGEYGWTNRFSQQLGYTRMRAADSSDWQNFLSTSFSHGLGRWGTVRLQGVADADSGDSALEASLSGRYRSGSILANHAEFNGLLSERVLRGSTEPLENQTRIRWSQRLPGKKLRPQATVSLVREKRSDGRVENDWLGRFTFRALGLTVTDEYRFIDSRGQNDVRQAINTLRLRSQWRKFIARASARHTIQPTSELTTARLDLDYRYSRNWRLRSFGQYSTISDDTTIGVGANYQGEAASVGFNTSCDSDDCRFTVNVNFSVSGDGNGGIDLHRTAYNGRGVVTVQGFNDLNNNGKHDDDEPLVPGLKAEARGGTELDTAQTSLRPHRLATVRLSEAEVDSPFMRSTTREFNVMPRPGHKQLVKVPLIETGEVDGELLSDRSGSLRPVAGVRMLLFSHHKEEVLIAETRTTYDGYFVFNNVPMGRYTLKIHPEDLASRGYTRAPEMYLLVDERGDLASAGQIVLNR